MMSSRPRWSTITSTANGWRADKKTSRKSDELRHYSHSKKKKKIMGNYVRKTSAAAGDWLAADSCNECQPGCIVSDIPLLNCVKYSDRKGQRPFGCCPFCFSFGHSAGNFPLDKLVGMVYYMFNISVNC